MSLGRARKNLVNSAMVLATFFASSSAAADQVDAVIAGASAGAAASAPRSSEPGAFIGHELHDWKDPRTAATTRLGYQCAHDVELRLSGTGQQNLLNVTLANESDVTTSLDPNGVIAQFESGLRRRLLPLSRSEGTGVRPGWSVQHTFLFPAKQDFEGQDRIDFQLPLQDPRGRTCTIKMRVERPLGMPRDPRSYVQYTTFDLYFGFAARVAAAGGTQALAATGAPALNLGFTYWPALQHGIFLEIALDQYGNHGVALAAPGANFDHPTIEQGGLVVGYAFRWHALRWMTPGYALAAGPGWLELKDGDKSNAYLTSTLLLLRQTLSVDMRFYRMGDGSVLSVAPFLAHTLIPFGSFGPADATGHSLSAGLRIAISG